MARNEDKNMVEDSLKLLKDAVALIELATKNLSKKQYDKGWHKGRETGRKEAINQ